MKPWRFHSTPFSTEFPSGDHVKNVSIKEILISLTILLNLINLLRVLGRSSYYTKLNNTDMFNEGHILNTGEIYGNWVLRRLKLAFGVSNYALSFLYFTHFSFSCFSELK